VVSATGHPRARVPTVAAAERYLAQAAQRNPGPWVQHSLVVAAAASAIAGHHPRLRAEDAYVLGLLHDNRSMSLPAKATSATASCSTSTPVRTSMRA
jgi:HD superfamily phosphohydrolase YqeK